MIDTSPWSSCSCQSPWLPCFGHTISSTGPSVSPFRDFLNNDQRRSSGTSTQPQFLLQLSISPLLSSLPPDPCVRMTPTNKARDMAMQTQTTITDRLLQLFIMCRRKLMPYILTSDGCCYQHLSTDYSHWKYDGQVFPEI